MSMILSDLPVDVIEEILCCVPAIPLKRLRSTCKLWNCLFQDKRFAGKHFDKAPKQGIALMLKGLSVYSMSVNLHGNKSSLQLKGELSLTDPLSSSDPFEIDTVIHCEGLLLCIYECNTRIVVWDPCTGQTRWIQPRDCHLYYTLGSYKDNKSESQGVFEICDINSNSWRILDVTPDCEFLLDGLHKCFLLDSFHKSLRGKTYWFAWDAWDKKYPKDDMFLASFDYTTERFGRLHLPVQSHPYRSWSLSVEREEKLCMLLLGKDPSITDIWVTNKTGETWSKVLALDLKLALDTLLGVSFLVDAENKVVVCCDRYKRIIVGEDNNIRRQVDYDFGSYRPFLINYVPTLTQIQ